MTPVFRLTVFFALVTSVFAAGTLDALVNAAGGFAIAIQQQVAAVQSITTPAELAEKTILYAAAKTTYYEALRAAAPELMDIASGKKPRPPEVDRFAQSFSVAGEKQEKVVDEATVALLSKLPLDSNIEKAKAAFDQAQGVEEKFHHDFDGVDFYESAAHPNSNPSARAMSLFLNGVHLKPLRNAGLNDDPIRQNDNEVHLLRWKFISAHFYPEL
jgi:hypothetical protein